MKNYAKIFSAVFNASESISGGYQVEISFFLLLTQTTLDFTLKYFLVLTLENVCNFFRQIFQVNLRFLDILSTQRRWLIKLKN